jgi:hypothetical protein
LLSEEETEHLATARHTILNDGRLLPVTNMMGLFGNHVASPLHAFSCIVYDFDRGGWGAIECKPGDIYPLRVAPYREPKWS